MRDGVQLHPELWWRKSLKITGAQALIESLKHEGVEMVFGIPAESCSRSTTACMTATGSVHILVRHEQGAAHAADGYARATGQGGRMPRHVRTGRDQPGHRHSRPPTWTRFRWSRSPARSGRPRSARTAFQEADITGITMPITKHNYLVKNAHDIPRVVAEAFHIARTGRPGPVLIDIPDGCLDRYARLQAGNKRLISHRTSLRPSAIR